MSRWIKKYANWAARAGVRLRAKRVLALFLSAVMTVSLFTTVLYATGDDVSEETELSEIQSDGEATVEESAQMVTESDPPQESQEPADTTAQPEESATDATESESGTHVTGGAADDSTQQNTAAISVTAEQVMSDSGTLLQFTLYASRPNIATLDEEILYQIQITTTPACDFSFDNVSAEGLVSGLDPNDTYYNADYVDEDWYYFLLSGSSSNQPTVCYYNPELKVIEFTVASGVSVSGTLTFSLPNGTTPDGTVITLTPDLICEGIDEDFLRIGDAASTTLHADFDWTLQKTADKVNLGKITDDDFPAATYTISGARENYKSGSGELFTAQYMLTDTMTFGGFYYDVTSITDADVFKVTTEDGVTTYSYDGFSAYLFSITGDDAGGSLTAKPIIQEEQGLKKLTGIEITYEAKADEVSADTIEGFTLTMNFTGNVTEYKNLLVLTEEAHGIENGAQLSAQSVCEDTKDLDDSVSLAAEGDLSVVKTAQGYASDGTSIDGFCAGGYIDYTITVKNYMQDYDTLYVSDILPLWQIAFSDAVDQVLLSNTIDVTSVTKNGAELTNQDWGKKDVVSGAAYADALQLDGTITSGDVAVMYMKFDQVQFGDEIVIQFRIDVSGDDALTLLVENSGIRNYCYVSDEIAQLDADAYIPVKENILAADSAHLEFITDMRYVTVTKEVDYNQVTPGDAIVYTMTITNTAEKEVTLEWLRDYFPFDGIQMTGLSWMCSETTSDPPWTALHIYEYTVLGGVDTTNSIYTIADSEIGDSAVWQDLQDTIADGVAAGNLYCMQFDGVTIPQGATLTLQFSATVRLDADGTYSNNAEVKYYHGGTEDVPPVHVTTYTHSLTATKKACLYDENTGTDTETSSGYASGDIVHYVLEVENTSVGTSTTIQHLLIADDLPAAFAGSGMLMMDTISYQNTTGRIIVEYPNGSVVPLTEEADLDKSDFTSGADYSLSETAVDDFEISAWPTDSSGAYPTFYSYTDATASGYEHFSALLANIELAYGQTVKIHVFFKISDVLVNYSGDATMQNCFSARGWNDVEANSGENNGVSALAFDEDAITIFLRGNSRVATVTKEPYAIIEGLEVPAQATGAYHENVTFASLNTTSGQRAGVGDYLAYQLKLENTGTAAFPLYQIVDQIPDGTEFVGVTTGYTSNVVKGADGSGYFVNFSCDGDTALYVMERFFSVLSSLVKWNGAVSCQDGTLRISALSRADDTTSTIMLGEQLSILVVVRVTEYRDAYENTGGFVIPSTVAADDNAMRKENNDGTVTVQDTASFDGPEYTLGITKAAYAYRGQTGSTNWTNITDASTSITDPKYQVMWKIILTNDASSTGPVTQYEVKEILPKQFTYVSATANDQDITFTAGADNTYTWSATSGFEIAPGESLELYMITKWNTAYSESGIYGSYKNTVQWLPYALYYPGDCYDIQQGQQVTDNGKRIGLETDAIVNMTGSVSTAAYKSVTDLTANSEEVSAQDSPKALGINENDLLRYTLTVQNTSGQDVYDMVVIDTLPFPGDTGVIDPRERKSDFAISFADHIALAVQTKDGNMVDAADYTVSYTNISKTADLTATDWAGGDDAAWVNDPSGMNTIRIVFSTALQGDDVFVISFQAQVNNSAQIVYTGDEMTAWNSFGYAYSATSGSVEQINSESYKVGVTLCAVQDGLTVEKRLVDDDDNIIDSAEYGSHAATEFTLTLLRSKDQMAWSEVLGASYYLDDDDTTILTTDAVDGSFTIKAGEQVTFTRLSGDYYYRVTEASPQSMGYVFDRISYQQGSVAVEEASLDKLSAGNIDAVVYNKVLYFSELPDAGGEGRIGYWSVGCLLIFCAGIGLAWKQTHKRRKAGA
ncbi:MAG: hypothetical protein LUG13_05850 [Oscillospiraceae bacterium]|nr:hypothetical protein [Oscillospiraceae bacterium]